ncbi:hypothetical protein AGOR_G00242890 [Albula goreensis]|uniref:Ig-like domain-containing protein n=1 Tax=Albula goreensis TaxID=1534307 RepID=A0A8T3CE58_9TELE|nr:hypothetical protein AGOR_G00242890 [Albula goreensis]
MELRILWVFVISTAFSLDVYLEPGKKVVSRVGDRLVLKCGVRNCQKADFLWRNLEDRPLHSSLARVSDTESQLIIENILLMHEVKIECKAHCSDGSRKARTVDVEVYSFPLDPVVSGNEGLKPGMKNDLTCLVRDVYPGERLKIEWVQGETVLKEEYGDEATVEGQLQSLTSVYSYTPKSEGKEESITCRATLDLPGIPANQQTRSSTVPLTVQPLSLDAYLEPKGKVVSRVGDRLVLKCGVENCQKAEFSWRSLDDKPLHTSGSPVSDTESHLVIEKVKLDHQTTIACKARCSSSNGSFRQGKADVTVYSFPLDPVVSGNEGLKPGMKSNLTCRVHDVYPVERLKIEWVQGEMVLEKEYEDKTSVEGELQSLTSVYSYTPKSEDNEESITCRATLDLPGLPANQQTRNSTVPLTVQPGRPNPSTTAVLTTQPRPVTETSALQSPNPPNPTNNHVSPLSLDPDAYLEPKGKVVSRVGDRLVLKCGVRNCQKAEFSWRILDDKPLHTSASPVSDTESHLVIEKVELDHQTTIACKARCSSSNGSFREGKADVTVYSFPLDPVVSGNEGLKPGMKSNLTCRVHDVYPVERLKIEWVQGETVLEKEYEDKTTVEGELQSLTSVYSYTPKSEDNEENITCRATLNLPGVPANQQTRSSTVPLTVQPGRPNLSTTAVLITQPRPDTETSALQSPNPPNPKNVSQQENSVTELTPIIVGPTIGIGAILSAVAMVMRRLKKTKQGNALELAKSALHMI